MLQYPTNEFPSSHALDGTLVNTFSFVFRGDMLQKYKILIYNSATSDVVYTGNEVTVANIYNGDTVLINIPADTFTNGLDYIWKLELWDTSSNNITSPGCFFKGRSTPTLSTPIINEIHTSRIINLASVYSQAENVAIRYHTWEIKDSGGEVVATTGKKYSANLSYSFDGLLSGRTYLCNLTVVNQDNVSVSTGDLPVVVSYGTPAIDYPPDVVFDNDAGTAIISWAESVQSIGEATGEYEFIQDFPFADTNSVHIISGEIVFNRIPGSVPHVDKNNFSVLVSTNITDSTYGKLVELSGDGSSLYSVYVTGYKFYEDRGDGSIYIDSIFSTLFSGQTATGVPADEVGYIWDDSDTFDDNKYWTETKDFSYQYLIILSPSETIIERIYS